MNLGKYYLNRPSEFKKEWDQALVYLKQALSLSTALHLEAKHNEVLTWTGKYYFIKNDTAKGTAYFMQVVRAYQKIGDQLNEAKTWEQFADCIPLANSNIPLKNHYYDNAGRLYGVRNSKIDQMNVLLKTAQNNLGVGKIALSEKELLSVLECYKTLRYKKAQYAYDLLADVYQAESNLHKELQYRFEAIKSMEASQDTTRSYYFYEKLAITYSELGEFDKSLSEVTKSLAIMMRTDQLADYYGYLSLASDDLLSQGKPKTALAYVQKASEQVPPFNIAQREDLYECFGNCFTAMKQFQKAENYYMAMMKDFKKTMFNQDYYTSNSAMTDDFIHYNQTLGNFYIKNGQYKKAAVYLHQVLSLPKGIVRPVWLSKIHIQQFRVDSALRKYLSAINHFELHARINDSLFNEVKSKQIAEVQTSYQVRQKEESIKALKTQAKLENQKVKFRQNIAIFSLSMLMILTGAAYYGYRNKRRSNFELQLQKIEISTQNMQLQNLVGEKNKLITEKDWLLNEVHHRVKNNLQIIISLLNTQSAYLKNDAAIEAISDSQHRVQVISLLHQKLYSVKSVSHINMNEYISDLVQYLSDCFEASKMGIRFEQVIDTFEMEPAQAIPVGLILNEAISNAVKYAFDQQNGQIMIGLRLTNKNQVLLTLADNGKGLPKGFDVNKATTLGMEMMKALSKQLNGSIEITNNDGAVLSVIFKLEKAVDTPAAEGSVI